MTIIELMKEEPMTTKILGLGKNQFLCEFFSKKYTE
jgi:hypothetical protein